MNPGLTNPESSLKSYQLQGGRREGPTDPHPPTGLPRTEILHSPPQPTPSLYRQVSDVNPTVKWGSLESREVRSGL